MTDNPTPDHVPTPITDWPSFSAAAERALHPNSPALDPIREWLNTPSADDDRKQLLEAVAHIKTLFTAIDDRDTTINRLRADAVALRSRLALDNDDRVSVEGIRYAVEKWGLADHRKKQLLVYLRRMLKIVDSLTRDGGGR